MKIAQQMRVGVVGFLIGLLAACGGGGGGGSDAGSGTLRMALADAPSCGFDQVNITVEKIRVHQSGSASDGEGGWSEIVLNPARRIDLLSLTNGVLTSLGETALPAGKYTQLRLVLADNKGNTPFANAVTPSGGTAQFALSTPSGQQSGLKAKINIDVGANGLADVVLDFDACKSIVTTGNGGYLLKPVLRVIPRSLTGVAGVVDTTIANGSTTVSLQQNGVTLRSTTPAGDGKFLLQPVEAGTYALVLTAPGRTTAVIRSVVVGTDTVSIVNTASTPLTLGTTTVGSLSGTVTATVTPIEADVRALQSLTGGPTVEIIARPVNGTTGAYSYALPVAAPMVASYVTGTATLSFAPDTAAAGKYSLEASYGAAVKTAGPFPVGTGSAGSSGTATFTFP